MAALQVKGLREVQRELRKYDKNLPKVVTEPLREVAEPIAATVRDKLASRFAGAKTNRVRPVVLSGRLVVRQTAQKKTGKRPDFGRTQMIYAFEPALAEHEPTLVAAVERAMDRMVES